MPAKKYHVSLTEEQLAQVTKVARSNKHSRRECLRARILLLANASQQPDPTQVPRDAVLAAQLRTSHGTVERVRQRFAQGGLEAALYHQPQMKRKPRVLDGAAEAHLIALVCGAPPEGHRRWELRLLRDKLIEQGVVDAISHETVRTTLKKMRLSRG